jgi:hypothetical protein
MVLTHLPASTGGRNGGQRIMLDARGVCMLFAAESRAVMLARYDPSTALTITFPGTPTLKVMPAAGPILNAVDLTIYPTDTARPTIVTLIRVNTVTTSSLRRPSGMPGTGTRALTTRIATGVVLAMLTTRIPTGVVLATLTTRIPTGIVLTTLTTRIPTDVMLTTLTTRIPTDVMLAVLTTRVVAGVVLAVLTTRIPTGVMLTTPTTRIPTGVMLTTPTTRIPTSVMLTGQEGRT